MSIIPKKWACEMEDEVCIVEIEHDRFSTDEPYVVSLDLQHHDGTDDHGALCCATPTQAREMAAALLVYAHLADEANARLATPSSRLSPKEDS